MKHSVSPFLSVVLAVHNEAACLQQCLESVKDLSGEIVVVDGASTDSTVSIARQFGVKVIATTNKANFHINKQMAMDAASGQLVLQLDADEVVDEELAAFIRSLLKQLKHDSSVFNTTQQPKAWWIKRKNWFMGRFLTKGGQYPDALIRLYLNGFARLPQKDVHEQMQVDGPVGQAEGHLLHYSTPTLTAYFRKFVTYTSFSATQLHASQPHPTRINVIQYLFLKPIHAFTSILIRHRGYVDGVPGFCFAFLSAWHFPITLLQWWELDTRNTK